MTWAAQADGGFGGVASTDEVHCKAEAEALVSAIFDNLVSADDTSPSEPQTQAILTEVPDVTSESETIHDAVRQMVRVAIVVAAMEAEAVAAAVEAAKLAAESQSPVKSAELAAADAASLVTVVAADGNETKAAVAAVAAKDSEAHASGEFDAVIHSTAPLPSTMRGQAILDGTKVDAPAGFATEVEASDPLPHVSLAPTEAEAMKAPEPSLEEKLEQKWSNQPSEAAAVTLSRQWFAPMALVLLSLALLAMLIVACRSSEPLPPQIAFTPEVEIPTPEITPLREAEPSLMEPSFAWSGVSVAVLKWAQHATRAGGASLVMATRKLGVPAECLQNWRRAHARKLAAKASLAGGTRATMIKQTWDEATASTVRWWVQKNRLRWPMGMP